jgi:hypothetical protein
LNKIDSRTHPLLNVGQGRVDVLVFLLGRQFLVDLGQKVFQFFTLLKSKILMPHMHCLGWMEKLHYNDFYAL